MRGGSTRYLPKMPLTVHFKCRAYLVTPTSETLPLGGKTVRFHEWEDGRVELHCEGRVLPYSIFDKNPIVSQGAIVENKRLGAVLAAIQVRQVQRDHARLASRKLSLREKERLRHARARAEVPTVESRPQAPERDISTRAGSGHLYLGLTWEVRVVRLPAESSMVPSRTRLWRGTGLACNAVT
jgi:hypothetical protein